MTKQEILDLIPHKRDIRGFSVALNPRLREIERLLSNYTYSEQELEMFKKQIDLILDEKE